MSIIITNITNPATPTGKSKYRIMINHRVIATYWHNREDGYAVCLIEAGKAVARAEIEAIVDRYNKETHEGR